MRKGRYYPTTTTRADGRVLITTGKDEAGAWNTDVEVWSGGAVSVVATRQFGYYPHQFVLPDGRVLICETEAARHRDH